MSARLGFKKTVLAGYATCTYFRSVTAFYLITFDAGAVQVCGMRTPCFT
jgi:hypothetical protein